MSAIPEEFVRKTARVSEDVTRPFPNSRKIYVTGSRPDVRVPMREVTQAATAASMGSEENPPITVYDTSGPYTDPEVKVDLLAGLPALRQAWIIQRDDSEELSGPTSSTAAPAPRIRPSRTCASSISAARAGPGPAPTSARCTTPARAS